MTKQLQAMFGVPTSHMVDHTATNRTRVPPDHFLAQVESVLEGVLYHNQRALFTRMGRPYGGIRSVDSDGIDLSIRYECSVFRRWLVGISLRRKLARQGIKVRTKKVTFVK